MSLFRRKKTQPGTAVSPGATALAEGWNGFPWGAPLSAFKARFPQAHLTESGWWQTGEAPEAFCGVPMSISQYAFDAHERLGTVAFIPEPENRPHLSVAVVNTLGVPAGMDLVWEFGDVVVAVKLAGVVATLTHPRYA